MNAVEIEQAVSDLAAAPFDEQDFPFAFLHAFGNKETTIKRLREGVTNKSDTGGVLQTGNIHILVAASGEVTDALTALRQSPATIRAKAKFILATDGVDFEAEDTQSGETVACAYVDFPDHFGFFLPLAGITTIKQIRESSFDIRATGRLNRLYVELLKDNPDWGRADRRPDMNHFMARLIFCFFAEDTDIFSNPQLFTSTIDKMSMRDSSNTHEVIGEIFRAMNTPLNARADIPRWVNEFPYVNGGLFTGSSEVPRFSRIARSYLLHIGNLDWKKVNPDIFGSMIQAVADDDERGALGMHYTSVPNILKVLNPLFLDDVRTRLEEAGDNARKLLNLRNRLARIRVFDPACGSGNFLVIAYKELRAIEAEINTRRSEAYRTSVIPLTNFRGIEIRDFPAEVARLSLIIAEYQCDVLYRGQKLALAEFLPLKNENWIVCGNALRLDWLSVCPPTGTTAVTRLSDADLFSEPADAPQVDFENEGGETYICGNPPYRGSQWQTDDQKSDLQNIFDGRTKTWKSLDYVSGWFMKAVDYGNSGVVVAAFVATNSICQGRQVETLWRLIFRAGFLITFAHTSFKWANLASHNAGVTVAIVGISNQVNQTRKLFTEATDGSSIVKYADNINAYLVAGPNTTIAPSPRPISNLPDMKFGNMPNDGGYLLMDATDAEYAVTEQSVPKEYIRPFVGSLEFIRGIERRCIWVNDEQYAAANLIPWLNERFMKVNVHRSNSDRPTTRVLANTPHRFGEVRQRGTENTIVVPAISSENRDFLPVGLLPSGAIISNKCYALYDAPLWNMALIASRLHWVWIGTVCVRLRTDFSYSNTLGWNTFPVPTLTDKNRADLTRCAEDILLVREAHFPATIADLYDPDTMPADLREAHERNDEVLERIYIGRRFRNDTERLEKLFDLYTKMTGDREKSK